MGVCLRKALSLEICDSKARRMQGGIAYQGGRYRMDPFHGSSSSASLRGSSRSQDSAAVDAASLDVTDVLDRGYMSLLIGLLGPVHAYIFTCCCAYNLCCNLVI